MSNYEGMTGRGVATQSDLRSLRIELQKAFNQDIRQIPEGIRKENKLKEANSRTSEFPLVFYRKGDHHPGIEGHVSLDVKGGMFSFRIDENNHAVDRCQELAVFRTLMRFIETMPVKGTKYGAMTHHWSEYDEDECGGRGDGSYHYYGGWIRNDPLYCLMHKKRRAKGTTKQKGVR